MVYPGNPEVSIEEVTKLPKDSSTVSRIVLGSHTGTHIDAPSHAIAGASGIEVYDLEKFIGLAKVLDFSHKQPGEAVTQNDLENILINQDDIILLKTSNSNRGYEEFYSDFVYLDGEAAEYLANKKIKLIGIDYLSIKQKGSKDNRPHTAFLANGIPILEGISLHEVSPGEYTLIGLPLKMDGVDGAFTRAVLVDKL